MFVLGFFLDLIFPRRCVSCGAFGSYFCQTCLGKIKPVEGKICPMCERASYNGKTHPGCQTRYSLDGLVSLFQYDGPIKSVVHRLKYKPWIKDLIPLLMVPILDSIKTNEEKFDGFSVVPVPLHPFREQTRGFNQAGLIGKEIAQKLKVPFEDDFLKRVFYTKPQVELKGKERRENIEGAFVITKRYTLSPKPYLLLVDDVWTTGSTLRACGNVLKRAGAKKVWGMTLAR